MPGARAVAAPACDRACLYGVLDGYLDALRAQDSGKVPWSPRARYVENNVLLPLDDGLWGTLSALGDYDLRFADEKTGEVGFFGVAIETVTESPFVLRLKVARGRVAEAEALVVRQPDSGIPFVTGKLRRRPELHEPPAPGEHSSRAELLRLANGYFDTLQRNDGTLHTAFEDGCNRIEDGMQTTNNVQPQYPTFALGCAAQFELGLYRYDDELRAREYPLVDEERGLILASGFIDHAGRIGTYQLTDGSSAESIFRRPHSFYFLEVFKIRKGRIQSIESVFTTVPYRMPRATEGASPRRRTVPVAPAKP
jgi:hypothetical protein